MTLSLNHHNVLPLIDFNLTNKTALEIYYNKHYNAPNITATLSARKSIAKPWRFFLS